MDVRLNDASRLRQSTGSSALSVDMSALRDDMKKTKTSPASTTEVTQDKDVLERALAQAEKTAKVFGRDLRFTYEEEADIVQVTVIDGDTDEVIRKIPPDEIVRLVEHINDMLGVMFDAHV